jgi:hypothetical protein
MSVLTLSPVPEADDTMPVVLVAAQVAAGGEHIVQQCGFWLSRV